MTNQKNATKNSNRFVIDFINKKIVGTKFNFNKASKGQGEEYEELVAKMAAHPDYALEIKEPEKPTKEKQTYKGMDYTFMEAFIDLQDNAKSLKKEYEAYKKFAKQAGMQVYPATKKWFLEKFSTEEKPFNMKEAQKAIKAQRYKDVEGQATSDAKEKTENQPSLALAVNQ